LSSRVKPLFYFKKSGISELMQKTIIKINFMELFKNFLKPTNEPLKSAHQAEDFEGHPIELKNAPAEREGSLEEIKRNYEPAIALRERQYSQDVLAKPEMKNRHLSLEIHNEIVLGYTHKLIKAHNLSEQDKAAIYLAIIFHDSGKLADGLAEYELDHHLKGREYAEKLLDELPPIEQEDKVIEITPELKEKVLQAIMRHMNHPFLVGLNKGKRFLEPENDIDKIVFDADMMANVGFKNVYFRLTSEKYLNEDIIEASKKNVLALEEAFNNVMNGVRVLDKAVLSVPAKAQIKQLIGAAEEIFSYLKANRVFQKIQDKYSENNEFNSRAISQKEGGVLALKEELNSAIKKAAQALNIDEKIAKNFIM